jgi:hypothetical protein
VRDALACYQGHSGFSAGAEAPRVNPALR